MSAYVELVPEIEHLRIRIPADVVGPFAETCRRKNLSKQGAIERLLRFWIAQEDVAQSMIVGQVAPRPDLVSVVLNRIMLVEAKKPAHSRRYDFSDEPEPDVKLHRHADGSIIGEIGKGKKKK